MSARDKLNVAYVNGVLILAGLLGLVMESGPVFFATAAVLFITSWRSGRIRPPR